MAVPDGVNSCNYTFSEINSSTSITSFNISNMNGKTIFLLIIYGNLDVTTSISSGGSLVETSESITIAHVQHNTGIVNRSLKLLKINVTSNTLTITSSKNHIFYCVIY